MSTTPQTVLVTGATTGIGRHAALHLARAGHHVIATGRNAEALESLADEARRAALNLEILRLDVTRRESIDAAVAEVDRRTGGAGVDVLVNNAGFGLVAPVDEMSDADTRSLFETNVFGLLNVTRAFLPAMRRRGRGRVINVSSIGGRLTMPFLGVYTATKYAVESLSDALRLELRPFGIDVVLVEPGPIRTEFTNTSFAGVARYGRPDSPYAPIYAQADRLRALSDKYSVGPEHVSRVISKAIGARRPAARYVAPLSSRFLLFFGRLLPTRLYDFGMRAAYGLSRRRLDLPARETRSPAALKEATGRE